jgi:hypothetical protein
MLGARYKGDSFGGVVMSRTLVMMVRHGDNIDYWYRSSCGLTLKRESGTLPSGGTYDGAWVLRTAAGDFVDFSSYQNDLASRHKLKLS